MKINLGIAVPSAFTALLLGCSGAPAPEPAAPTTELPTAQTPETPAAPPSAQVSFGFTLMKTAKEVDESCAAHLAKAQELRNAITAVQGERTLANTLAPMNELNLAVYAVQMPSGLMLNVHPDKAVRDASEKCVQASESFMNGIRLDQALFLALSSVKAEGLEKEAKRFLDIWLREYRRAGVDKDEATRKELAALYDEEVKIGQEFSRNILEDKRSIEVSAAELEGLPEDYIKARLGKNGKAKITTDQPDYLPLETYAKNEKVRASLHATYNTRAYPKNESVLRRLLEVRNAYAHKLGYEDWAAYHAEDKMVKDKKTISDFLTKVGDIATPRMKADLSELLARKKKDDKKAKVIREWDRFYYINKIKTEKYGVDAQEVRKYFSFPAVKLGLMRLTEELYGITFKKVETLQAWHESVEAYDLYDHDNMIARMYLDMHPRDGKYSHMAMFPMSVGITDKQLPAGSLVCNFPQGDQALMEHRELVVLFHEFGHMMHHLLAGKHHWANVSGISCEWDFVEVPSQLYEAWAWDPDVLRRFALHVETKAAIPTELVEKMKKANEFGKGVDVMRQMFFAKLSFDYHSQKDAGKIKPLKLLQQVQKKYSPYPYEKGTYLFASFGHLQEYSSMYYTYMWSLMVTKDLEKKFKQDGLMNPKTAALYREAVLAPGGAVDAVDMAKAFLGRDYTFDAFREYLEQN
ncbi:MAG: Zn-dependent oligopeptidase [Myxococcota bacterium]|nr:Zn-dependent oligopeptidase [Myxococcota bacterium]